MPALRPGRAASLSLRALLGFAFPDHCLSCDLPLSGDERHLCAACLGNLLPKLRTRTLAPGPHGDPLVPDGALFLFAFTGPFRRLVHALKFEGRVTAAGLIAELAAETGSLAPLATRSGIVVVPVPLHPTRLRSRGYNQAALLGEHLARLMDLPTARRALFRARPTSEQARLGRLERTANVAGAFRARPRSLAGAHALLVDDVVTTGATLLAAAGALVDAAPESVTLLGFGAAPRGDAPRGRPGQGGGAWRVDRSMDRD